MKKNKENKIALGTAQFSNNYGVTNRELLSSHEIKHILKDSSEFGIKTIDTAPNYDGVEKKLGKFDLKAFNIVTKISLTKDDEIINSRNLNKNIQNSLTALNLEKIYAILIRNPTNLMKNKKLLNVLIEYKKKNKISKIGYTLYNIKELSVLYSYFKPDIVQIPYSIVDKSFENKDWLTKMYNDGIEVHVRSVFLQGLLLINEESLPREFSKYREFFKRFDVWIKKNKISKLVACLSPLLYDKRISKVIVGINSRHNLAQINNIKKKKVIYPNWLQLKNENLLNPSKW